MKPAEISKQRKRLERLIAAQEKRIMQLKNEAQRKIQVYEARHEKNVEALDKLQAKKCRHQNKKLITIGGIGGPHITRFYRCLDCGGDLPYYGE